MSDKTKQEIEAHIRLASLKEAARLVEANRKEESRRIRAYNDWLSSIKCG